MFVWRSNRRCISEKELLQHDVPGCPMVSVSSSGLVPRPPPALSAAVMCCHHMWKGRRYLNEAH